MHLGSGGQCQAMSSKEHSRMLRTLEQLQIDVEWVVPENIHTYTTGGISEFRRGEGVTSTGILRTWGGRFMGLEFRRHGGDFQDSNFQFGVVKSLQEKLVKNDLSKDG